MCIGFNNFLMSLWVKLVYLFFFLVVIILFFLMGVVGVGWKFSSFGKISKVFDFNVEFYF